MKDAVALSSEAISRRSFLRKLAFAEEKIVSRETNTLVCVFLRGGADTLNMLVPYNLDSYYRLRPNISIKPPSPGSTDAARAIKLNDHYAFHPKMLPLLSAFQNGRLGMVQSVGTDNTSGSHFAIQDQVEHGQSAHQSLPGGWLGRHLQASVRAGTPLAAVAIGTALPEALRGAPAASVLTNLDELKLQLPLERTATVAHALATMYQSEVALLREPGQTTLDLLHRVEKLKAATYAPANGAVYPDNSFGRGLREVARLVKGSVGLEVACIDLNGWDTHFFQGSAEGIQAESIKTLADGLSAFDTDLLNCGRNVTAVVITEFGRRTYENSSMGTDHGRAFTLFALGESICGGVVHGALPDLLDAHDKDFLGPAGLPVVYDYRSALSEILVHAAGNRSIGSVFPNFFAQEIGLVKPRAV